MPTDYSNTIAWLATAWFVWAFLVIWTILAILGFWKMFTKAGEAGWKSIIPIWSTLVWLRIIGRPWWWLLLLLIPVVNFVILAICLLDTAASFGRRSGFAVGLLFLTSLFVMILGWGRSVYVGPRGIAPGSELPPAVPPRAKKRRPKKSTLPDLPPLPEMPPMPEPAIPPPGQEPERGLAAEPETQQ